MYMEWAAPTWPLPPSASAARHSSRLLYRSDMRLTTSVASAVATSPLRAIRVRMMGSNA